MIKRTYLPLFWSDVIKKEDMVAIFLKLQISWKMVLDEISL